MCVIYHHVSKKKLHIIGRIFLSFSTCSQNRKFSTKIPKPLRILFCGSDNFSVASLKAVESEMKRDPGFIKSIDVLCRPGKPVGRGLKNIAEAPIKAAAHQLGLRVHERDSFSGWNLPCPGDEEINLLIAVSFGIFVPPRILNSLEYGGLNVHPSLLPNFRGAAPIQHTLLAGNKFTGVSLQTLHDKSFDRGIVLDQTKPFLEIPPLCTYEKLVNLLAPMAADMLALGLKKRLFIPPLVDVAWAPPPDQRIIYAKKITSADKKMPWNSKNTAETIIQAYCALGSLWSDVLINPEKKMRLKFDDISPGVGNNCSYENLHWVIGADNQPCLDNGKAVHFIVVPTDSGQNNVVPYVENELREGSVNFFFRREDPDVSWSSIAIGKITIEGKPSTTALRALKFLRQGSGWSIEPLIDSRREIISSFSASAIQA